MANKIRAVLVAAMLIAGAAPAVAEGTGTIELQLNKLTQAQESCKMALLFKNASAKTIKKMTLELVTFETSGAMHSVVRVNTGALAKGKSRLRQYALKGVKCQMLSRVLVNDVNACEGEGLTPAGCLTMLSASSRLDVKFGL